MTRTYIIYNACVFYIVYKVKNGFWEQKKKKKGKNRINKIMYIILYVHSIGESIVSASARRGGSIRSQSSARLLYADLLDGLVISRSRHTQYDGYGSSKRCRIRNTVGQQPETPFFFFFFFSTAFYETPLTRRFVCIRKRYRPTRYIYIYIIRL